MKRRLSEAAVSTIMTYLVERFGEPIGKAPDVLDGVADERGHRPSHDQDEKMGNRGFGAELEGTCQGCGGLMGIENDTCTKCGEMAAEPEEVETAIVVIGGKKSPRGAQPGGTSGRFAAGVHPPKDMDIPPEALPKRAKPAGPSAPPSKPVAVEQRRRKNG